jgi:hypothetical protein
LPFCTSFLYFKKLSRKREKTLPIPLGGNKPFSPSDEVVYHYLWKKARGNVEKSEQNVTKMEQRAAAAGLLAGGQSVMNVRRRPGVCCFLFENHKMD